MNPEELVKQCVEALSNTPEFSYLRELMKAKEAEAQKAEYEADEAAKAEEEKKAEFEEKEPEKAEGEVPSGSEPEEKEEDDKLEPAKLRMQRDQERRKYAKLESQYKALFAKVEGLERDKRLADRKADLLALEGEGFAFDLAEELDDVADMSPKAYSKHLSKIKKNYTKAPIGVSITPAPVKAEGGLGEASLSPEQVAAKAIKMAQEKYSK